MKHTSWISAEWTLYRSSKSIHQRSTVPIQWATAWTDRWRSHGITVGPLLANVFVRSIEETLEREDKMLSLYKRYVHDTLTIMPDTTAAATFLPFLKKCHSSVNFTMETEDNGVLPFQIPSNRDQGLHKTYEHESLASLPEPGQYTL